MNVVRSNKVPLDWELQNPPARSFAGTTGLQYASAAIAAAPFTMAAWFRPATNSAIEAIIFCGSQTSDTSYWCLCQRGDVAGDPVGLINYANGFNESNTTRGFKLGQWHHACAVEVSSSARYAFIDGGSKSSTNVTTSTPAPSRTAIGYLWRQNPGFLNAGKIMLPAVWNVALTDGEVRSLAQGVMPWQIRPQNLIFCPDMRTLYDPFLRAKWTNTGSVLFPGRQFVTKPRKAYFVPTTTGSVGSSIWWNSYGKPLGQVA